MRMKKHIFILLLSFLFSTQWVVAQNRRVNPVKENYNTVLRTDVKNQKKPPFTKKWPGLKNDTIIRDTLFIAVDTTKKEFTYPKINGITVGANIWDPIMRVFGQKYGGIGVSAEVSLWNKIFPHIEAGVGTASHTPEDMNFTYKSTVSPYFKVGVRYNFLHGKSSDYQLLAGLNFGYSSFKYDIENISINSDYWGQPITTSINGLKSNALWGEASLSLRVKIAGNISMGWSAIFHKMLSYKKNVQGNPWYVPGYGTLDNTFGGAFSIYYTLPLNKNKKPKAFNDEEIK